MILQSLTVTNVGPYAGAHTFHLEPKAEDRPIILIGGMNGAGKTTFLESLQLALYGRNTPVIAAGKSKYHEYLKNLLHTKESIDTASIELCFKVREDGEDQVYSVVRSWTASNGNVTETLGVKLNGFKDKVLTDFWAEEVERLIPRRMAGLFFFDGEQIERLAEPNSMANVLEQAVNALLGVDLTDQLDADLRVLLTRRASEQRDRRIAAELDGAKNLYSQTSKDLSQAKQAVAAKQNVVDRAESAHRAAEADFEKHGGRAYERSLELEAKLKSSRQTLAVIDEELREHAAGALPLALASEKLRASLTRAQENQHVLDARERLAVITERDAELLNWLNSTAEDASLATKARAYLSQTTESLKNTAETPIEGCTLPTETLARGQILLDEELPRLQRHAETLLARRANTHDEIEECERIIARAPKGEQIQKLAKTRALADSRLEQTKAEHRSACDLLKEKERTHRDATEKLEKLLSAQQADAFTDIETQRFVKYANRARKTLENFRNKLLNSLLHKLENNIVEAYTCLLQKERFVESIEISPANYHMTIQSGNKRLNPERLSAGERQLLAIATIWGLTKSTASALPLVVDTPLGRLDSIHRKTLLGQFFPEASHQVIILSTDQEVQGTAFNEIKKHISHTFLINYDPESRSSQVKDAYFESAA
jgi:DNA sulfur modification protein DndD